jgi:hypothetical protein
MSVQQHRQEPRKSIDLELSHRAVAELNHQSADRDVSASELVENRLCLSEEARGKLGYLADTFDVSDTEVLNYLLENFAYRYIPPRLGD